MEQKNPFENPVSKEEFNGFWIPRHNAKVMKQGLESNNAPFLPDASGKIYTDPIYNVATGYCLPAGRLIPVQFAKMEKGYISNVVATRTAIGAMGNALKENEKGVFYNFKDETGDIHTASLFFPEQTQNPDDFIKRAQEVVKGTLLLPEVSMVISNSDPKEYLATYIAACRTEMKLSVDPKIAEEFKTKIMPILENDLQEPSKRDKNLPSLSNILFEAEKRGTEIVKSFTPENADKIAPEQEQKKSIYNMDMCF
ncbi:MAG: hypothetical protein MJ185_02675 [Treponema sp.]|nr:hypothetical protein [Treponema sp.]